MVSFVGNIQARGKRAQAFWLIAYLAGNVVGDPEAVPVQLCWVVREW